MSVKVDIVWAGLIVIFGIEVCSIPLWNRYRTLSSGSIEVSIPTTRYRPPLIIGTSVVFQDGFLPRLQV